MLLGFHHNKAVWRVKPIFLLASGPHGPNGHEPIHAGSEARGLCPFGVWVLSLLLISSNDPLSAVPREKMGMLCTVERREVSFFLQRCELSLVCGNSKERANKSALLLLLQRAVDVMSVTAFRATPGVFEQTFSPTVDILVASESWPPVAHNGIVAG